MAPVCWFFCLCLLSTAFLSSHGVEEDRTQLVEEDEDVETAVVAILPFSGERGTREALVVMRPRPGREEDLRPRPGREEDLRPRLGREEEMPESSRSPPFAPRLGRYFITTPRLGRRRS